jgi:triphosphoribosyl-dephospho-CoA synthetase
VLQTIFTNLLQLNGKVLTLPFWNVISWPKVDLLDGLAFARRYMEIMEPLCVAALGHKAALACQGNFRHTRPVNNTSTTDSECFMICRSNLEDPESVFIMVPMVHPGFFRYNLGHSSTHRLAQMQWFLFFLITTAAVQVVSESSESELRQRSTLIKTILSHADTVLQTNAGRSLLKATQREAARIHAEYLKIAEEIHLYQ